MFESIITTLSKRENKKRRSARVFDKFLYYSMAILIIAMTFKPAIMESTESVRRFIGIVLLIGILVLFIFALFYLGLGILKLFKQLKIASVEFKKQTRMEPTLIIKRIARSPITLLRAVKGWINLGDPLINRGNLEENVFEEQSQLLVDQYDKQHLEKFKDWLEYRIKYEGVVIAVLLTFLRFAPSIKDHIYTLFDDGIFISKWMTNPFETMIFPVSFDFLLLGIVLLVIVLTAFIPKWFRYLNYVKFALAHGYPQLEGSENSER